MAQPYTSSRYRKIGIRRPHNESLLVASQGNSVR